MSIQNEFSDAFSPAFDPPVQQSAPTGDICYPDGADWSCAYTDEELAALDPKVVDRSNALAWSTLSALLGYRLSLCPVIVRPCAARCAIPTWDVAPVAGLPTGGVFTPHIRNGTWYNACGCRSADTCGCSMICEVILPTPVGLLTKITIDGAVLDPTAYRVDNGNRLVRMDGTCWPACQDMNVPWDDADGTFAITYYPFLGPNDLLRFAAGVLATEFYKGCTGKQCRLPNGVTSITRNGLTMEIPSGLFPNGATGIREVDPIIRIYNPNGITSPARVLSPDSARGRFQTWGS